MRWADEPFHTEILKGIPSNKTRESRKYKGKPFPHIMERAGKEETLLWCVERKDGGRGFGFTGGHNHENWQNDEFRKLILNAIVWLAKVNVPEGGVPSTTPTDAELHHMTKADRGVIMKKKAPKKTTAAKKSSSLSK